MLVLSALVALGCAKNKAEPRDYHPNPKPDSETGDFSDSATGHGQDTSSDSSRFHFQELEAVPEAFRFVVFADPQLGTPDSTNPVHTDSFASQVLSVRETNAMNPEPAFTIWVGDLVDRPDEPSFENFEDAIEDCRSVKILTHGNHDSDPPYYLYKAFSNRIMGFEDVYFSFNAGSWHFVVLPSLMDQVIEEQVLEWLSADLARFNDRPTIVFEHFHGIPIGLNQLEWYGFPRGFRARLQDVFEASGNVRYYLNGHVHNGVKASVKTARTYRGTTYVTVPTITRPRPFGEEYDGFEQGTRTGGYYLVVDVDGEDVRFTGRLAGAEDGFAYPTSFPEFTDDMEPRWRSSLQEMTPNPELLNGGFESASDGPDGWRVKFRYYKDVDPAFAVLQSVDFASEGTRSLEIRTSADKPEHWAYDEHQEVYQILELGRGLSPKISFDYFLDAPPNNGGGMVRLTALSANGLEFVMLFKWGDSGYYAINLPKVVYNEVNDGPQSHGYLEILGSEYRGMFFDVDDTPKAWHSAFIDMRELYDRAHMKGGAFDELKIEKVVIGLITWVNKQEGSRSSAYFDNISYRQSETNEISTLNGKQIPCDGSEFRTQFARWIQDVTGESLKDTTTPLPARSLWREAPYRLSSDSVEMTAVTAVDPHEVQYYFEETSGNPGGDDSGWQASPVYVDTGLQAGHVYSYRVQTRDMWSTPNTGDWSTESLIELEMEEP